MSANCVALKMMYKLKFKELSKNQTNEIHKHTTEAMWMSGTTSHQ
jgi:hypothetical protein